MANDLSSIMYETFVSKKRTNWESLLKANPIDWLLESKNPSVWYYTLVDIMGYEETNLDVIKARQEIMISGAS